MIWSRGHGQSFSNDLAPQDSGVYHGIQEVAGREFGLLEQESGFKLIAAELCHGLSDGERIQCVQGSLQQLQMARLDAPEKSAEQTLSEAPADISLGPEPVSECNSQAPSSPELDAAMSTFSRQHDFRPVGDDIAPYEGGLYRGMEEFAGEMFGVLAQGAGFKLVDGALCEGLTVGERVVCVPGESGQAWQVTQLSRDEFIPGERGTYRGARGVFWGGAGRG